MASLVYDCFPFFNELDILEMRLNILSGVVDKFVLVEADRTFSNMRKPLFFEKNKIRYSQFLEKIIYIKTVDYPEYKDAWNMEYYQRNKIIEGISCCDINDIILVSDVDEIPNPDAIKCYRKNETGIFALIQDFYNYYLNYKRCVFRTWDLAKIAHYDDIMKLNYTPQQLRDSKTNKVISNGGWHFSYLGGIEAIQYKIGAFSHQEYNNEKYVSDKILEEKIRRGLDIYNRKDYRFIPVKITKTAYPAYIVNNKEKYSRYIYKKIDLSIILVNTAVCLIAGCINTVQKFSKKLFMRVLPILKRIGILYFIFVEGN
jgi:beta-1,4-mannosyl-glycoprotein beta-1,4-N-acetylglucosaminyltransferase